MSKTLLIIGGTGIFGRAIINAFHNEVLKKWQITRLIIASRNPSILLSNYLSYKLPKVEFLKLDLNNALELPKCDYVMHLAASSQKSNYTLEPLKQKNNIVNNMRRFCWLIESSKYYPEAILFASSGAVYGKTSYKKFSEIDDCINFNNLSNEKKIYAAAKIEAEKHFMSLTQLNVKLSIARCFSFVGPEIPRNSEFLASNLISNIVKNETLTINSKSSVVRSYLHTEELVTWLMEILVSGDRSCQIYNIGSDNCISIHSLAKKLAVVYGLNTKMSIKHKKISDYYVPNIEKANKLGLYPRYNSIQSIIKTVEEIKENERWIS